MSIKYEILKESGFSEEFLKCYDEYNRNNKPIEYECYNNDFSNSKRDLKNAIVDDNKDTVISNMAFIK